MKWTLLILSLFAWSSCEFSKSASKDLITGLTTQGDGLASEQVYLSDGEQKISRTAFTYGEKFYVNFDDIDGFTKNGEYVFPGMQMLVVGQAGDTVMKNHDLYEGNADGFDISPLLLQAHLTAAAPIHSNNTYTLHLNIWDKKGKGTFNAKMDFSVVPNNKIAIESRGVSYDEIYLFSQERKTTIIGNSAGYNETIYLLFEGLEGFTAENGKVYAGLSMKATDATGEMVISEEDLLGESAMEESELKSQLAPNFIFTEPSIKSPVVCEIEIWDKKSESRITASLNLELN